MTDDQTNANSEAEGIELSADPLTAFTALMDVMVAEENPEGAAEGGAPDAAAADGTGAPAAPAEGAGAGQTAAGAPADGAAGAGAVPDGTANPGGTVPGARVEGSAQPAGTTATGVDALTLAPKWAEITTSLEQRQTQEFQTIALGEVREEFARYVEAVGQHPRSLVGQQVPRADGKEGLETLKDSQDAREWQEQIKLQLAAEVRDRASRKADQVRPTLNTVHASIKVFQDNHDLIPGTKQFDAELAKQFVTLAEPYQLKVDGKMIGWTIPVQGLISQARAQLVAQRTAAAGASPAATAAASGQPTSRQQAVQQQPRTPAGQWTNPDLPQAGLTSKAGASGGEGENFDALFGTIGLAGMRI